MFSAHCSGWKVFCGAPVPRGIAGSGSLEGNCRVQTSASWARVEG